MTKIVLDANFLRYGQFSLAGLLRILDSVGPEAEVVIPEVVVWEWAEHASGSIDGLIEARRTFRVDRDLFEPPALLDAPSKLELVRSIQAALPRWREAPQYSVEVWRPSADLFGPAVKAQVLQTGVAERKKGVKTGAADHLVLECVRAQLEDRQNAEPILLASGDKGLRGACRVEFGADILTAGNLHDLLSRLTEFVPAEDELFESVEDQLRDRIPDRSSDIGAALAEFDMGFRLGSARTPLPSTRKEVARLGRVWIVELHSLEIGEISDNARVGFAELRVFADVDLTTLELQRNEGGDSEWATTLEAHLGSWVIDLTADVTFDLDWKLASVNATSPVSIEFDPDDLDGGADEGEGFIQAAPVEI